jgi:hypothetical protein
MEESIRRAPIWIRYTIPGVLIFFCLISALIWVLTFFITILYDHSSIMVPIIVVCMGFSVGLLFVYIRAGLCPFDDDYNREGVLRSLL